MALKKCRECGKEISSSVKSCPHCGVKNPVKKSFIRKIIETIWLLKEFNLKKFNYILCLFVLFINLEAKQTYGNIVIDEVTSIYDGDTFRVNIKSYPEIVGKKMAIRVNGIDTPEMRGKCKKEKDLARQSKQLTVSTLRNAKKIELRNLQRGKYFRIVADVYADGKSLADIQIKNNLAVKYDGGTKIKDWCK